MISESLIKKNPVVKTQVDFSIIMVVFNTEIFIKYAIESVINQTYENWELIIVDDCSEDNSFKIAMKYQKQDNRIKCFKLDKNRGQGFARNFAIDKANGTWISTLDSDDIFLSDKLEVFKNTIDKSQCKNLVLIGSGLSLINNEGKVLKDYYYPNSSNKLKKNLLKLQKFPAHSSIVCPRSSLKEVGGYNELYHRSQDYELWLRLMNKGEFICIQNILIHYRIHDKNASNQKSKNFTQYHYGIAALVCHYLRKNNIYDPSNNKNNFNYLLKFIDSLYQSSSQEQIIQKKKLIQEANKFLAILILIKILLFSPSFFFRLLVERLGYLYFYKTVLKNYICKYTKI